MKIKGMRWWIVVLLFKINYLNGRWVANLF
jgi:hypothetical protein